VFAGAGLRLESGDAVSAMAVEGFTQLDEAFDLADRVPVPVGRYDLRQLQVFADSSPRRAVSLSAIGNLSRVWDGRVDSLQTNLRVAVGPHLEVGPTWTVSQADLPGGAFTAHVLGLRLGWAFSTRLFARAYVQYNSLEQKWITNLRLNFIHRPKSDLYVVFNDDQGRRRPLREPRLRVKGRLIRLLFPATEEPCLLMRRGPLTGGRRSP
jgi:hypothetical protein